MILLFLVEHKIDSYLVLSMTNLYCTEILLSEIKQMLH